MSNTTPRFDPVAAPILPATPEKALPPSRLNIGWLRQRFSCPPPVWQPEPEPVVVRGGPLDDAQLLAQLDDWVAQRGVGLEGGLPDEEGARQGAASNPAGQRAGTTAPASSPVAGGGLNLDVLQRHADVPAAVLIALVPLAHAPNEPGVVLTVRSRRLRKHRGQIAFPGGRVDEDDASVEAAALREAHEEIGLASSAVQLLGRLPAHPTGTGFYVHPVVGVVDAAHGPTGFSAAPDEVDEVFVVPLSFLMNPANHRRHLARWQEDGEHYSLRFYSMPWTSAAGQAYFIWGATATMLRNLYRFLIAD